MSFFIYDANYFINFFKKNYFINGLKTLEYLIRLYTHTHRERERERERGRERERERETERDHEAAEGQEVNLKPLSKKVRAISVLESRRNQRAPSRKQIIIIKTRHQCTWKVDEISEQLKANSQKSVSKYIPYI